MSVGGNSGMMSLLQQVLNPSIAPALMVDIGALQQARAATQQTPIGLTGMDPRMMSDPRFDVQTGISPQGAPLIASGGEAARTTFDPKITVKYLADVDDKTLRDDMWAVTAGGHKGTSVGDEASEWFKQHSKDIVGDAKTVTPAMVKEMRQRILQQRYGEIRQTHPGKPGFTPEGPRY